MTAPTAEREKRAAFSAANSRVDIWPLMMPPAVEGRASLFTILAFNAVLRGPIEAPLAQQRTSRARITDNLDGTYVGHVGPMNLFLKRYILRRIQLFKQKYRQWNL